VRATVKDSAHVTKSLVFNAAAAAAAAVSHSMTTQQCTAVIAQLQTRKTANMEISWRMKKSMQQRLRGLIKCSAVHYLENAGMYVS